MNVSAIFVRRPVATTLIMLAVTFFGLLAYKRLPVAALPNVDFPTINVSASLPGASPETMAASVATPLEREFSTIDGIDSMTSSSVLGSTQVTIQFDLQRDLDSAALDVQAAISRAAGRLPKDMPSPPVYRKVNPADQPVYFIALSSESLPLHVVNEYGDTMLAQRISTVRGVALVQVFGSQKFAMRVQVDPNALASRGVELNDVSRAIQSSNVNLPTGAIHGPDKAFTLETNGQLSKATEYNDIVVAWRNGTPVRIKDVGNAFEGVENDKVAAWFVDKRAIVLAVFKQPGANVVEVADAIRELIPSFQADLPQSIKINTLFDRSESVRESVRDVQLTLAITLVLVLIVIFGFLRSFRATVIPALAMPLSIAGTFIAMDLLGYSLNNLSLMALTLSVGFVVDDAIVVLENIVRHRELGKSSLQAALDGSKEIFFTIVSMTLSLVVVFVPIALMGGILGRLFLEFSVTIAVSIIVSAIVSVTLTPMMGARVLGHAQHQTPGKLAQRMERGFDALVHAYTRSLVFVLNHQAVVAVVSLLIMVLTVVLFRTVPKGFLPNEDISQISVQTEMAEGVSFDALRTYQQKAAEIVRNNPNVEAFMSSAGNRGGGVGTSNGGSMFIRLKPRHARTLSAEQVIAELRPKLAQIPGLRTFLQVPPPIRIGGRLTRSEYQVTLQANDTKTLFTSAQELADALKSRAEFQDISLDLQLRNPQLDITLDRDRAASLGISASDVDSLLYSAYGSRQVSTIFAPTNAYAVILELDPKTQRTPSSLDGLHLRGQSGELVPLRSFASVKESLGPLSVNHAGQLPAVTVSFNLTSGISLSTAVESVTELSRGILPEGVSMRFQGAAEAFQSSIKNLGLLLLLSVVVIYLVLGILYESFLHPLTILSALPFAGFGALLTLLAFGVDLNVYAFVGLILLVGLVKKNGIMMIDFAIEARRQGASPETAIIEACKVRFRPITMTTMAALFGTLPIAVGVGAGAESRQPLGLSVVGGLLFSQLLTLYATPAAYLWFERLRGSKVDQPRTSDPVTSHQ